MKKPQDPVQIQSRPLNYETNTSPPSHVGSLNIQGTGSSLGKGLSEQFKIMNICIAHQERVSVCETSNIL